MADHSFLKKNANATVRSVDELMVLDSSVTDIIIDNGVSDSNFTVLDLTRFTQLRSLEVGNHCFTLVNELDITGLSQLESVVIGDKSFIFVDELKLIGLNKLESVEIGMNSFTKKMNWHIYDPNRHFYLKNCPKLKSLKMGRYSFSDYSVFEIENVDALEVIEMGELNQESYNFAYASLELKSILIHSK